ncbi:hypothetical protein [Fluviispira vulneris]|uniref:hypothetical protein n=1 Tax=Fluviispira vulneris TaxID=2763012 RepID=UPI001649249F|nr:hypothetical protein [Fluviispira vulneris]
MFKWTYSENVSTEATPEQIWALWQDTSAWPSWDTELKWVKLFGDFSVGTTGRMKPINGPEVEFKLSRVERYRAFSDIAQLPLTKLVFDHEYFKAQKENAPAYICHTVTMNDKNLSAL